MLGPWEWFLLFIIALLVFGPAVFVRAGGSLGAGVGAFKKALKDGEARASKDNAGAVPTESGRQNGAPT